MSLMSDIEGSELADEMFGSVGDDSSRHSLSPPRQQSDMRQLYFNFPDRQEGGSDALRDARQGPHNQNMDEGGRDEYAGAGNGLYGYDAQHMGLGMNPKAPRFRHANASQSPWQDFESAGLYDVVPVRSLVLANIPVAAFARDATRFVHWQTPMSNPTRAVNLAALIGMIFTPLSKGWP